MAGRVRLHEDQAGQRLVDDTKLVNLDDYLFSDFTELKGMQWQALIYDKQACKVIATWTNM